MNFEELNTISRLIKLSEAKLKKECWKGFIDGCLKWDQKLKRLILFTALEEKPLIEWSVEIRVAGFKELPKFIEKCLKAQEKSLGIEATKEELERLINQ